MSPNADLKAPNEEKALLLIASSDIVCREMFVEILGTRYEVMQASDSRSAEKLLSDQTRIFALLILDMESANGEERAALHRIAKKAIEDRIPVIPLVNDDAEINRYLDLGAMEALPRPFPPARIISARVGWIIELYDKREIILTSERDPLTGLYNSEFFFGHAEQYDKHHPAMETDAIVIDIQNFNSVNERYGKAYGDDVLRRIGVNVRNLVHDFGGIVCRQSGDTFLIYCPHGQDYTRILQNASIGLTGENRTSTTRVRLRMGVYACADKSIEIERRFDRAKYAAKMNRSSYSAAISVYDSKMHAEELFAEQIIEDFQTALVQDQFVVFYQPKYDIRGDIPVLASAEALVRWNHPKMGLMGPNVFIPIFEKNGMIQELDCCIWNTVARQIREWRDRYGFTTPVSVNVSRIDMFDRALAQSIRNIVKKNGLSPHDFLLEITESAYTEDSNAIIETVHELRQAGFRVEMDDFGSGYSSLSMIASLPVDAVKLDMAFVQGAFRDEQRNLPMLKLVMGITDFLSVPVIAEGVETEQQFQALKSMGCAYVQGFYFSKPVPPGEFSRLIEESASARRKAD